MSLPLPVFVGGFAAVGIGVIAARYWWVATAFFFAWLPFEDLVRKFEHNDLRVYLIKDVLLLLALASAIPKLSGCWRRPLGSAWFPTLTLLTLAVVMAIPTGYRDVRVPLGGLHLRFFFLLLLPLGVLIGRDRRRLRITLTGLCALAIVVCGLGIAQSIVGTAFLNPARPDALLRNLTITKVIGAVVVVRPPGPFVDAGRFGTFTTVSMLFAACLLAVADSRTRRLLSYVTFAIAGWATFASGGRTALIFGITIALFALGFSGDPLARRKRRAAVFILGVAAFGFLATRSSVSPDANATFYSETLSPTGANSELVPRLGYYTRALVQGVRAGGLIGRGTGDQAIGQQYFTTANYTAESGFGSLATEWGPIGLSVWLMWTVAWIHRALTVARRRNSPSGPVAPVIALFVVLTLTFGFALGIQSFENYITNAFFWFFSGIAFSADLGPVSDPRPPSDTTIAPVSRNEARAFQSVTQTRHVAGVGRASIPDVNRDSTG